MPFSRAAFKILVSGAQMILLPLMVRLISSKEFALLMSD